MKSICEIYPCLQGEGSRAGTPSLLVRTLGCNLRCAWCDTPYTSHRLEKGRFDMEDIRTALETHQQLEEVILTGGEPTLCPEIGEIIALCEEKNKRITLETNGTRLLTEEQMRAIDLVSLSPKLSNSTPKEEKAGLRHEADRIHLAVLHQWIEKARHYQLKFVVSSPEDIQEIEKLIEKLEIDTRQVYLMPEGRTEKELQQKRLWLADLCIRQGFHYCERLHIVIYGDKRGV